jgi:hypothetical protein
MLGEGGERRERRVDGEPSGNGEEPRRQASVEQFGGALALGYVRKAPMGDEEACTRVNLSRGRLTAAARGEQSSPGTKDGRQWRVRGCDLVLCSRSGGIA